MRKLLVGVPVLEQRSEARVGGRPWAPAGFTWPHCAACKGPMQFQFQMPLAELGRAGTLLLAFQCANDPGMCSEWEPASGGNAAFVTPARKGQITERAHAQLNYGGGGRAYSFICDGCEAAKFLWQR